jgi:hypothetical protein
VQSFAGGEAAPFLFREKLRSRVPEPSQQLMDEVLGDDQ